MASLVTVAIYYDMSEAFIAKSLLEQHGFTVFLHDSFFTGVDWVRLFAVGGLRLTVPEPEAEDATHLLTLTKPVPSADADAIDLCPSCGSDSVFRYAHGLSLLIAAWALWSTATIFYTRSRKRRCRECGHRWRI